MADYSDFKPHTHDLLEGFLSYSHGLQKVHQEETDSDNLFKHLNSQLNADDLKLLHYFEDISRQMEEQKDVSEWEEYKKNEEDNRDIPPLDD